MRKNLKLSRGYIFRRYSNPVPLPHSQSPETKGIRHSRSKRMNPLTYQNLLDKQTHEIEIGLLKSQTAANRATVLRAFLKANHLNVGDTVGRELRLDYAQALGRYVESLTNNGVSSRNITNSSSIIKHWKKRVAELDTDAALKEGNMTPFQTLVRTAMKGKTIAEVSRVTGINPNMLIGWCNQGRMPRRGNERFVLRLESYLGLERESLLSLTKLKRNADEKDAHNDVALPAFNRKIGALTRDAYYFVAEPTSPLRAQWTDFMRYKTAQVPALQRVTTGKWRFSPCPMIKQNDRNWFAFLGDREVASADINWGHLAKILGWMALPESKGGAGLERDLLHTMAWLVTPDFLERFIEWHRARVGALTQGSLQTIGFIVALVRPTYGYLRQRPNLQKTLPDEFQNTSWNDLCDQQFALAQKLNQVYQQDVEKGRDSFAPIKTVISASQPMDVMAEVVQRMRADRPFGQPKREILWSRDFTLLKLLISAPLRLRNLAHLTWREDNTGELYQKADGSWWLNISKRRFKNTRGAAGANDYQVKIHESAWQTISQYIKVFRPQLLNEPSDLVFLAANQEKHTPWGGISTRLATLTQKYFPQSPGFRAHSFRHIVATSIGKASGGDFVTAALVLNDSPAVVQKHYSGVCANDGAERMAKLLEGSMSKM